MMNIVALINISFFQAALRMATPIAFASLGGMYNERAGVVNIGLRELCSIQPFSQYTPPI